MVSTDELILLIQSLIWLLAGVGVFIVGMNFMSEALEKSASEKMKQLLEKISNHRFSGVTIGAGVTAIIQSSSATSVMIIGLVNAGVMTLMQATPIIMGANIGTTITGVLVALKNDYFNMLMYVLAFVGVMMGFFKNDKIKIGGLLCSGLGLIFVGLNIMSSPEAFGNPLVEAMFTKIFSAIDFPLLLILVGVIFTALIQSSSAATGVVITMVGTRILPLDLALFIILGANIGTCVTALLASLGANVNAKRVAFIHFTFNAIGTLIFTIIVWCFKEPMIQLLTTMFPGSDPMSLQMRVSMFHVIFNVTTTCILLPFVSQLVRYSCLVIKDRKEKSDKQSLKFVDERLLKLPSVALMQTKKEITYMYDCVFENIQLCEHYLNGKATKPTDQINQNEITINFINNELTKYLIQLAPLVDQNDEAIIGSYFHVLNDLERIGDHVKNIYEIITTTHFSQEAQDDLMAMSAKVHHMLVLAKEALISQDKTELGRLVSLEDEVDQMKKQVKELHFNRLKEGLCTIDNSSNFAALISDYERMADHAVNIGFSISNPTGEINRAVI